MDASIDFYDQVREMRDNDQTWETIAGAFGSTVEGVRSRYRRLASKYGGRPAVEIEEEGGEDPSLEEEEAARVFFQDKKTSEAVDWREFIDLAQSAQDLNERLNDIQRIAEIQIDTDRPVGIVNTGDWHLGDGSTDHVGWRKLMDLILNEDCLFMGDLGDDRQNARNFKNLAVVLNQVLSPMQQARMLRSVVDELTGKNKLLWKVSGNHDVEFDERVFGEALQSYLLEKMRAPRFENRGLVKLRVGEQLYTIVVYHKSRFSSFIRQTHGNFREYQLFYPADIIAGAHDHVPGFEVLWNYNLAREAGMSFGGETFLIKVGTFQDSSFGWKYFHNGSSQAPTVVLHPDCHKKLYFSEPGDAVRYIKTF